MTSKALAANGSGEREPLLTSLLLRRCCATTLNGAAPHDPRFSPIFADLAGLPPIVLGAGEDDLIRRDGLRLAEAARAAGVVVTTSTTRGSGTCHTCLPSSWPGRPGWWSSVSRTVCGRWPNTPAVGAQPAVRP